MNKLLFVCLGNICRSPAAEEIMRTLVAKAGFSHEFEIDSAGTYSGHTGQLPDPRMRAAARDRGYMLTHRARQFRNADFDRFDMIITMDDANYENVCRMAQSPEDIAKVYRMTDFCEKFNIDHVPDPY
jgi:protein-tyrosine phosphatase